MQPKNCLICDKICVPDKKAACHACKQFFRRTVAERMEYQCFYRGQCRTAQCRSCRLDKCLLAGLEPRSVFVQDRPQSDQKYFALMDLRKSQLLARIPQDQAVSSSAANDSSKANSMELVPFGQSHHLNADCTELDRTMASLSGVEWKMQKLFQTQRKFKPGFVAQFRTMANLLASGPAIIDDVDKFTLLAPDATTTTNSWCSQHDALELIFFAMADVCRSMPTFRLLPTDDQVRLVNFVAFPLDCLLGKYNSARLDSEVEIVLPWKLSPLLEYRRNPRYADDNTIQHMADLIFRCALEPFGRTKLTEEEYLLLRAIIASHSYVPNLSPQAQKLLQADSERYARLLMRMEQARLGHQAGAMRYAAVLHLAECTFRLAERARQMVSYLAMVVEQDRFYETTPGPFVTTMLSGVE